MDALNMERIARAPEPVVRAILNVLCRDTRLLDKAIVALDMIEVLQRQAIERRLQTERATEGSSAATDTDLDEEAEDEDTEDKATENEVTEESVNGGSGPKKKADTGMEYCVQCDEPFYEDENHKKACCWHDGEMEHDSNAEEDDENEYYDDGIPLERTPQPETSIWTCRNDRGDSAGCNKGYHKTASSKHNSRYAHREGLGD
ncbi:Uu.00g114610.m01.CDS01 [Anthostomella pinea]|uniref:Uu.00g114610.m01.CDS01 n=1 Tax=Anthostomella pinea TaxID=933095 RepID=A0AAI8YGT2_9PEZI|nr:Uu.00g114610.m01.CDS01 [Anthostomella pinea]